MFYFGYIYLILFILIEKRFNKKQKLIISMIPFLIIIILRYGLSADYFSYQRIYNQLDLFNFVETMNKFPKIEPLFKIMSMIFKATGFSYHFFNASFSILIVVFILFWLISSSRNYGFSSLLYYTMVFFVWNLSALRQGFTIAFLSFIFFNDEKEFSFKVKVFATIIAVTIHSVAFFIPLFYLISKLNWNVKKFLIILIIAPFTKLLLHPSILEKLASLPFISKFSNYLTADQISFFEFTSLVRLFFFLVLIFHYDKFIEKFPKYKIMLNYAVLSMLLYFFIPASKVIATRITIYGYFTLIIILPMIVSLYTRKQLRVLAYTALFSFSVFSFYNELSKMKLRSGYLLTITEMGFETILNKNVNHFANPHILDNQIYLSNEKEYHESELVKRVYSVDLTKEVEYNENLTHYSVYFQGYRDYGIVNEKGEIVEMHTSNRREAIYGEYVEQKVSVSPYEYYQWRVISTERIVKIDLDYVNEFLKSQYDHRTSSIRAIAYNINRIDGNFLSSFSLNSADVIKAFIDSYDSDYKILRISTELDNYSLIITSDDKILIEKWYNRIDLFNNGIFKGYTDFGIDFINSEGEIIWFETY